MPSEPASYNPMSSPGKPSRRFLPSTRVNGSSAVVSFLSPCRGRQESEVLLSSIPPRGRRDEDLFLSFRGETWPPPSAPSWPTPPTAGCQRYRPGTTSVAKLSVLRRLFRRELSGTSWQLLSKGCPVILRDALENLSVSPVATMETQRLEVDGVAKAAHFAGRSSLRSPGLRERTCVIVGLLLVLLGEARFSSTTNEIRALDHVIYCAGGGGARDIRIDD
ncbi:hypothetical protein KM043_005822 [Ampulex compressa]|nr:hypothetical protein KM043_005822 [Ampulex compressa]